MLSNIGVVQSDMGDYVKALEYLRRGLALREAIGDKAGTAHALNNIGTAYRRPERLRQGIGVLPEKPSTEGTDRK